MHSIKQYIKTLCVRLYRHIDQWDKELHKKETLQRWNLPESVDLDFSVDLCGNITIGEYSYINAQTRIASGEHSSITIGKFCAIGRYVHIMSYTHDQKQPTFSEKNNRIIQEKNIIIGNYVWIGDKVFIKEGITIGDHAIIGANSVVTRDIKQYEIVGGVPARHIKYNTFISKTI